MQQINLRWWLHCLYCPSEIPTPMTTAKSSQWRSLDLDPAALVRCLRCLINDDLCFVLAMTKQVSIIPKGLMNHMHICDYISYSKLCRGRNALHSSRDSHDESQLTSTSLPLPVHTHNDSFLTLQQNITCTLMT